MVIGINDLDVSTISFNCGTVGEQQTFTANTKDDWVCVVDMKNFTGTCYNMNWDDTMYASYYDIEFDENDIEAIYSIKHNLNK